MKISLNHYASNLLVESKASTEDKSFNQLLTEAMELLHEKYTNKVQHDHQQDKPQSS